jgi:hypothetical protein
MTSALYNADTRCFSRRGVYSKIKNADSRQFAQHRVLAVVRRWIPGEVLSQLFLGNHFANTGRAFLENHGLVVRAARLDMCCQREPPDGREHEDGARTGSHQTGVSISIYLSKAGPPSSRVRTTLAPNPFQLRPFLSKLAQLTAIQYKSVMNENVRSMVLGPSVLYGVAIAALVLTLIRKPAKYSAAEIDGIIGPYLMGIAFQCLHFTEEFVTGFYVRAPEFLGFVAWSTEFFVVFNLVWIAVWLFGAVGLKKHVRVAFFPVWFFAIAMVGNAIWHPLLCLATRSYFPGLFTSPFAGVIGVILLSRLWNLTTPTARVA